MLVTGVVELVYPEGPYCTYDVEFMLVAQLTKAELDVTPDVKTPEIVGPAGAIY
jgi:hypothetical protein